MRIAVVGSYGVGLTMRVGTVPEAGETVGGGAFSSGHGGKGSNQAVAARRLGAEVSFLTAIGSDAYGDDAVRLWSAEGVDARSVRRVDDPTMIAFIMVDPSGENRIIIAPGALDALAPADIEVFRPELAAADIAVVSLEIPARTALRALELAHGAGTRTILNPAPATALPDTVWEWVDVLTPNQTELRILLGVDPADGAGVEELALRLHARSGSDLVVTLGADGALVVTADGLTPIAAVPPLAVVDTTGAGDSFTAALAVGLAEGLSLVDAARFAARVGSLTVGTAEVIPALPFRQQLDAAG